MSAAPHTTPDPLDEVIPVRRRLLKQAADLVGQAQCDVRDGVEYSARRLGEATRDLAATVHVEVLADLRRVLRDACMEAAHVLGYSGADPAAVREVNSKVAEALTNYNRAVRA